MLCKNDLAKFITWLQWLESEWANISMDVKVWTDCWVKSKQKVEFNFYCWMLHVLLEVLCKINEMSMWDWYFWFKWNKLSCFLAYATVVRPNKQLATCVTWLIYQFLLSFHQHFLRSTPVLHCSLIRYFLLNQLHF